MKEEYKLTWKEFVFPVVNYWTYNSRQKPKEKRTGREEREIINRIFGMTLYNTMILTPVFVGLEELIR
jgi:hypothetical protein